MAESFLEQALFGYDDGHRLLRSSSRLSNNEKDLLLQLSDLGPGISKLREDGYWTGMPLRETFRYALMRTWPAPEMSRPGCVWTHVLLIPFEFLVTVQNPFWLSTIFKRPQKDDLDGDYARPVSINDVDSHTSHAEIADPEELISCLYFSKCSKQRQYSQQEIGIQALSIWFQQWTGLRNSFNFRTVEKPAAGRSWLLNFDMMLTDGALRLQREAPLVSKEHFNRDETLVRVLVSDLLDDGLSSIRIFRERFGVDFPLHPLWTPFLASVQLKLNKLVEEPIASEYDRLLNHLGKAMPDDSEGSSLKGVMVNFSSSSSFRLPFSLCPVALSFLATNPLAVAFPEPKISSEVWRWSWTHGRGLLLSTILAAGEGHPVTRGYLLSELVQSIPGDELMEGISHVPEILKAVLVEQPQLLQWQGLLAVPGRDLCDLLANLSESQVRELDIVQRLIMTKDSEVARSLCKRFPAEVVFAVCTSRRTDNQTPQPHHTVMRFTGEVAATYLVPDFLSRLNTTSSLFAFAAMLGFVNPTTIKTGPLIWADAIQKAKMNSSISELQALQAFLFSLGLALPQPGSQTLFEYSFQSLHEAMRESRLGHHASVLLERFLPDVSRWRKWDSCHRLRIALISAYVRGHLSPISFLRLSKDKRLVSELFHELESGDTYGAFLEEIRRTLKATLPNASS